MQTAERNPSMNDSYDSEIATLTAQVERDIELYKGEKARFYRLEGVRDEEITEVDRNTLVPFSRSCIRDYNMKLEKMEANLEPTPAQKELMQLLNRLIMLGDEVSLVSAASDTLQSG